MSYLEKVMIIAKKEVIGLKEERQTKNCGDVFVPICEKYLLTVKEASAYFSIGIKSIRRLAEDNEGKFAVFMGNRYLIVREQFEEYINSLMDKEEENQP